MSMRPKSVYEKLPDNLTFDTSAQQFRFRNPISCQRKYVGNDKKKAVELAEKANEAIRLERLIEAPTIESAKSVVEKFIEVRVPNLAWKSSTRKNNIYKLKVLQREWGIKPFNLIDRLFIADWLSNRCKTGDAHNKWRYLMVELWNFAISRKIVSVNEAEATLTITTSKKLERNQRIRKRLTLPQFWGIHESAPLFLQTAMELSLVTLQARAEILNIKYKDDFQDGYLYVIRQKVAPESEMGFIRIKVTPQIEKIKSKAVTDGIVSPYLVRRRPKRKIGERVHWTYILPQYLTKQFQRYRDSTDLFKHLEPRQRPTFHEIRSLGARIYRAQGYPKSYIQQLSTHSDQKTTEIYLNNPDALRPENYLKVEAGMRLKDIKDLDI